MKNQVGSSRVDTVLKMLLIAFISLLAFSSGVFFGKQMSDSDYKLKALESDFNHGTKTVAEHSKDLETPDDALAEDEVASLSDKFVNAQKDDFADANEEKEAPKNQKNKEAKSTAAEKTTKTAAKEHDARKIASTDEFDEESPKTATKSGSDTKTETVKPDLSAAHRAAARVANNAVPTEPTKPIVSENRAPAALPRTVGTAGEVEFTVQIASYPTAETAKLRATEMVKKGFPAFPVEATVNGKTWYRVSVGSFKSMREATTYRAQLMKEADLQSAIVQRIQR